MSSEWTLVYTDFDPAKQGVREALTTLGNGYFCTRGAFTTTAADDTHYPGTYLAGGYNRAPTEIAGRIIENEDLVNLPNWLPLTFRPVGGDWFNIMAVEILSLRTELQLKHGLLQTTIRFRDHGDRETTMTSRRIVSMSDPHLAAIEMTIEPENWSGEVEIASSLDGRVINAGVKRYRELNSSHLEALEAATFTGPRTGREMIYLQVQTNQSHVRISQAARTRLYRNGEETAVDAVPTVEPGFVSQSMTVPVGVGNGVRVEKVVAIHTSRDVAIAEPGIAAREAVDRAGSFDDILKEHATSWNMLWARSDIEIETDEPNVQMILRLHIFQLLQTVSHNTVDLDVGVPARGWHGEAYRGHVFWDELFILPFLNLRLPAITRGLLRYRYNRLPKARLAARDSGVKGAMYPWQSGSDGREESQVMHLNPRSGRWVPDHSWQQRHVNLSLAYNVWLHYVVSGDKVTLEIRGAEMILEIARLFSSISTYNEETGRYEIHSVMGPDEYHEAYPDSEEPGLNNNAYTNVMVAWLMGTARKLLDELDAEHRWELIDKLHINDDELKRWDDMSTKMLVPFHDGDIISQFSGYEALQEFDWAGYREKYKDIQRLDRILEAEGDTCDRYKLSKQADVLMLFYLFSQPQLAELMGSLGYKLTPEMWHKNIDYYMARTSHGSTLSYVVHSWVLARSHPDEAWEHFVKALHADVSDIQGGTTAEGIHLGAMAGTVDLVQRCFTGLTVNGGGLRFDPVMTDKLRRMKMRLRYQGNWINVDVTADTLKIEVHPSWAGPLQVFVRDAQHSLEPGQNYTFPLN